MKTLEIIAANHGGYIVRPGESDYPPGYYRPPLFAGQLAETLDFIRQRMEENDAERVEMEARK